MSDFNYQSMIIGAAIAVPVTALVTFFGKALWYGLSGVVMSLFSDIPKVSGSWVAGFTEPDENCNESNVTENVKLSQFGRYVWGKGSGADNYNRTFKYKAVIKRNTIIGTYRRIGSSKPTGAGAFQLIAHGNDDILTGKCVWYDYDTNKIESSDYNWRRNNSLFV